MLIVAYWPVPRNVVEPDILDKELRSDRHRSSPSECPEPPGADHASQAETAAAGHIHVTGQLCGNFATLTLSDWLPPRPNQPAPSSPS